MFGNMYKLLILCLSIINILSSTNSSDDACLCDSDNRTIDQCIYDDSGMRDLKIQLGLLIDVLKAIINTLHERLEYQTDILKQCVAAKEQPIKKPDLAENEVIDVRSNFGEVSPKNGTSSSSRQPHNCAEATANTRSSGLYSIQLESIANNQPFWVACDEETNAGGWTVIQKRMDGSIDFYRNWTEYQLGFGNLNGEYWIGLDKLHALTTQIGLQELIIVMIDFEGTKRYAHYSSFAIGNENEGYALNVLGNYSGDAGDSLTAHVSQMFSTKDKDNDNVPTQSCAVTYNGAWWYKACHVSNLNGQYLRGAYPQEQFARGVVWHTFRGYNYGLKFAQMMIRPQRL